MEEQTHYKVIIVGSGVSGLTCAHELEAQGTDYLIVEANTQIGGRVRGVKGFVDWKTVDAGGEFIHGDETILMDFAIQNNLTPRLLYSWAQGDLNLEPYPIGGSWAMYYFASNKQLISSFQIDSETKKANNLIWSLSDIPNPPKDETLEHYLAKNGVKSPQMDLIESGYANTLCNSLNGLSLHSTCLLEKEFLRDGHADFRLQEGMRSVVDILSKDKEDKIKREWPVISVDYSNKGIVKIKSKTGEYLTCDHLVLSIPITQYQNNSIQFSPPLPEKKINAIKKIPMQGAMKLLLKVSHQFWPREAHGIICAGCPIPEIWFDTPERLGVPHKFAPYSTGIEKPKEETYLISGFVCASFAERLNRVSDEEKIKIFINQLNEMFGGKNIGELMRDPRTNQTRTPLETNPSNPASLWCLSTHVINWMAEPYISGGYSSPSFDENENLRDELAKPVRDLLFFCGEATQRNYMSVHGAMNSGKRVAAEIMGFTPRSKF